LLAGVSVVLLFQVYQKIQRISASISPMGRELLFVARILIATCRGAKMHQLTFDLQRNRSFFRNVHTADWIAHEPSRIDRGLLTSGTLLTRLICDRARKSMQHPSHSASQHCHGPAQYH
jgi:hypothetical protein